MNQPFGSWQSPLTAQELTRGVKGFVDLQCIENSLVLQESRPEEAGRNTLLLINPQVPDSDLGSESGSGEIELTAAPFNVRSRVHEYGGGAFLATNSCVFFVNFTDQNIYVVDLELNGQGVTALPPRALTTGDATRRYADFALDSANRQLVAVCEQHHPTGPDAAGTTEPENLLVSIDLESGEEHTLHSGHDFYASPRICDATNQIAFVTWDHPAMPWDSTRLYQANLGPARLDQLVHAEGGKESGKDGENDESILQPSWLQDGSLVFASDRNGYWNLHKRRHDQSDCLCEERAEYASPAWVFGLREHVEIPQGGLVAIRQAQGLGTLCAIDLQGDQSKPKVLDNQFAGYHALCTDQKSVYALAERTNGFSCVVAYELASGRLSILRSAGDFALTPVAEPEALSITNRNGEQTHAWLYMPRVHADSPVSSEGAADERPPLLVLSHGGPTSATSPALNPRIQYYTSRGWAVVDVNYGGSTGYGRAYRERLRNNWGVTDVQDCEDVARSLAENNRVDGERMAIKGGSAGGYTTLAALTFGDVFAAGASHYGIGDLNALAAETHKFEARYVDGLIPPTQWDARSPINYVDSLACPVIFFQGSEDAVVPPGQAQDMVNALKRKGLPVAYVEFEGEGHGFRQASNIQHAAAAEYQFFCTVFGIQCPDDPVDLTIENLA